MQIMENKEIKTMNKLVNEQNMNKEEERKKREIELAKMKNFGWKWERKRLGVGICANCGEFGKESGNGERFEENRKRKSENGDAIGRIKSWKFILMKILLKPFFH